MGGVVNWPWPPPGWYSKPHSPECQITVAQRGWMSVNPPRCTCDKDKDKNNER